MQVVRIPPWGFSAHAAPYHGYYMALHLGPWLIFVGRKK